MNPRPWSGQQCARCTYPMAYIQAEPLWVEHCYRCGGSFVQRGQVGHAVGEFADPSHWKLESFVRPPMPSVLSCPAGHGRLVSYLLRHEAEEVEIDGCQGCGGMWLDDREARTLAAITREHHHEKAHPGSKHGKPGIVATYLFQLATQLPIEVHNPLRRRPLFTWGLAAVLGVVFVLQVWSARVGFPVFDALTLVPARVQEGRVDQLITHAFLHANVMHLVGNVYMLVVFGDNVEDALGRARYVVLYAVAAVLGGVGFMLTHWGGTGGMLGASGAVSGLMGAYLVLFPRTKLWFNVIVQVRIRAYWYMAIYIGLNLLLIAQASGVAWEAHLGGFLAGVLLALAFKRGTDDAMPATVRMPRG